MHHGPVVGSILEGSAVYQIEGQPESVLRPGDVFFQSAQRYADPASARIRMECVSHRVPKNVAGGTQASLMAGIERWGSTPPSFERRRGLTGWGASLG